MHQVLKPDKRAVMQFSRFAAATLLMTLPALADTKVDFAKQIQPIFQRSCVKCHGPEKQKGGLRLDDKAAALKGGKDAVAIVPGDAAKSDLYRRITLPDGSDDVMPNQGELLSKPETDLIRDWINQGANWPDTAIAKAEKPAAQEETYRTRPQLARSEFARLYQFSRCRVDAIKRRDHVNGTEFVGNEVFRCFCREPQAVSQRHTPAP
jgi:mono/diheme cytochrome c family protein